MAPKPCGRAVHVDGSVPILLVSPHKADHVTLRQISVGANWELHEAFNCQQALAVLENHPVAVVVTEHDLPDGTWHELLQAAGQCTKPPRVVVSSRLADARLWAEVLNLGGYDVLATPFELGEATRVLTVACGKWKGGPESHDSLTRVKTAVS